MAALDAETEAKVVRIMKRARLKQRELPKVIRALTADISQKRRSKDMAAALAPADTTMLTPLAGGAEKLARLFLKKKAYPEIKGFSTRVVRAPKLKPGVSAAGYVLLATAVRVFLLRYSRLLAKLAKA